MSEPVVWGLLAVAAFLAVWLAAVETRVCRLARAVKRWAHEVPQGERLEEEEEQEWA